MQQFWWGWDYIPSKLPGDTNAGAENHILGGEGLGCFSPPIPHSPTSQGPPCPSKPDSDNLHSLQDS
jgi:hypothetical protein